MESVQIGDLVESNNERGVICSVEPLVMRTTPVRTYVPLFSYQLVEAAHDTSCTISDQVLQRIRVYLDKLEMKATGD